MAKKRTVYVCSECGADQPKWVGQCPACETWNTMKRMTVDKKALKAVPDRREVFHPARALTRPSRLSEVATSDVRRIELPIRELNRVLGGGVVPGSLTLIGGEPGIGKSTLVLQAAALLAERLDPVLYVSGEESAQQIKLRAGRLGLDADALYLMSETNVEAVLNAIEDLEPKALVVDSVQSVYLDDISSSAGSVKQVREVVSRLMRLSKGPRALPVFLVGHVTKSGDIAGPRIVEHMVDVVLYLEGDRFHSYRLLRGVKNRFGSTNEVGVFEMQQRGMVEIANPSEVFLAERLAGATGSAVTVTLEGTRPLLVEIQALVSNATGQVPRRTANGIDFNRLLLLAAVLTKRLSMRLGGQDIFVNVVGGLKIVEPAADLAVAAAIASSTAGVPLPDDLVVLGEIGLSGELRSVSQIERRLAEAGKLGFGRALVPQSVLRRDIETGGLEVTGAKTAREALDSVLTG